MARSKMTIGVMLDGIGGNTWAWRRKNMPSDASVDINYYLKEAKAAEAAKLDFIFIADTVAIDDMSSPHYLNRLEPMTMLGAMATVTHNIGLVGTLSTSYTEPFTAARQLASLDMITSGRAGWNVVTSALDSAALNHSMEKALPLEERYARAREHVQVVRGLWDSWEDDAFIRDKAKGVFCRPEGMHRLMHKGKYFRCDGPLNISRSPQGHPVLFQAGASVDGRDLAASIADAIFGVGRTMEEAKEYYDDVKARAVALGRSPDELVFMPAMDAVIGRTEEDVEAKIKEASSIVSYKESLKWLGFFFSYHDFSQYDPDAPLPDLGDLGSHSYRSVTDTIKRWSKEEGLTLRQIANRVAIPRTDFIGTAEQVADSCERWFRSGACDGFILSCNTTTHHDFYELVLPILRERGLFRDDYEDTTFRGNLGLPKVPNRYSDAPVKDRRDAILKEEAPAA